MIKGFQKLSDKKGWTHQQALIYVYEGTYSQAAAARAQWRQVPPPGATEQESH